MNRPEQDSINQAYSQLVKEGGISMDHGQLDLAQRLDELKLAILDHLQVKTGILGFFQKREQTKGLYIWGDVGRGKTMLMDMFYKSLPTDRKQRIHFHGFMQEVHYFIHNSDKDGNSLDAFAKNLSKRISVICFDEFQVTNIADAMILKRLFEALIGNGIVVVATSNIPPDRLYEGGLHRERFLPFIEFLLTHVNVYNLNGDRDYRRRSIFGKKRFFSPLDETSRKQVHQIWEDLVGLEEPQELDLFVNDRIVTIPRFAKKVAWFTFHELCGVPFAAADYMAIAKHINTIIIEAIPKLDPDAQDEAHRLQTMIDVLYESGVLLVASAAVDVDNIYVKGKGAAAFKRTASRLHEMCHA